MTQRTAADALTALSDPHRRHIVEMLQAEPMPVRAIADQLPISRPAVSRHLKQLKSAGLVSDEAVGTRRIYRLDSSGIELIRSYLDSVWRSSLQRFASAVDEQQGAVTKRRQP